MAWTAPETFTSTQVLTAAAMNRIRDNMLETAPAKASLAGQYFVATAANSIAARLPQQAFDATSDTTTSSTFGDLSATAGPSVTVTTGTSALVILNCRMSCSSSSNYAYMSFSVSGATTRAADTNESLSIRSASGGGDFQGASGVVFVSGLTPGSNTFKAVYRLSGPGTGTYDLRRIVVFPY